MALNDWNTEEVRKAESRWGEKLPPYILDMFDFVISRNSSILDLGCGFGRFLEYLLMHNEEADYIGYDSSPAMINRITERFPFYSARIFNHNLTDPITHSQSIIICSAVFIHTTLEDQETILKNIKSTSPDAFTFDINCPSEQWLLKGDHFERQNAGFRMTWQSHYSMTRKLARLFPTHKLTMSLYPLPDNRHRAVYQLTKGE